MDSGLHEQKPMKRQKKKEHEEDIVMNKLPESLVSIILSLLPTKDAVRTSVLSNRWKHQWLSITNLDLDDTLFYSEKKKKLGEKKQHFVNFVYRALLLTKSSNMDSFTIDISNKYDVSVVNTWICSALKRKLKKLCISSEMGLPLTSDTTNSLFNSELLEELELYLNMIHYPAVRFTTSYVHLGNLKSLTLIGITFVLETYDYTKVVRLSFPLLQKYQAIDCTWTGTRRVVFEVPMLESLYMNQRRDSIYYQPVDCCMEFAAPHLKEITYCSFGYMRQYITKLDPPSVPEASASIILEEHGWGENVVTEFRIFRLLKQFSQVKYLKFEGSQVLPLSKVALLPTFGRLDHLELGLVADEVLLCLLLKTPVLKSLTFKGLISKIDQELLNLAAVPFCMQNTLELVKFEDVRGREHELSFAKFMIENGLVLKRMSFLVVEYMGRSEATEEFEEKLFSFKKGSRFAIDFSYNE